MSNQDIILDADPFSLITTPNTIKIDLNKVIGREDIEHDPIFMKKYMNYLKKKESCYVTRLSLSRIVPGFYKNEGGKSIYVEDSLLEGIVEHCISLIKSGERPPLHIYQIFNNQCEYDYSSPDDVHVYYAYKTLKINKVPVIIYGSAGELEESAFKNKGYFRGIEDNYHAYTNVNIQHDSFYSVTHSEKQSTPDEIIYCLERLESLVTHTKLCFKNFHELKNRVHYHQIIYAILMRLGEDLASIKLLINHKLYIQSAGLLRSIYELMLNFYLVWVSPREMSSMLKYKSLMSRTELHKVIKVTNPKLTKAQFEELKRVYNYQYNLVSKVVEKAKFSPFGESYYENIYRFLSDITHHDFSSTARYRHALEHGDDNVHDKDILQTVVSMADFITTFVCHYAMDDIGYWQESELNKAIKSDS